MGKVAATRDAYVSDIAISGNVATKPNAVFTIVSSNYTHYALTLLESLLRNNSEAELFVILCDTHGTENFPNHVTVLPISELPLPEGNNFVFRYDILELNTAVKPFAFNHLFAAGYQLVTYFDPDIYLFSSLEVIHSQLTDAEILLTPHITAPISDNCVPQELDILRAGTFNLGFLSLKRGDASNAMLDWWSEKLTYGCINNLPEGYFVDQKWMDLVPSLFHRVKVIKDVGWNVAYWNLHYRMLTSSAGDVTVNGQPLRFFHFSGFSATDSLISKHQTRFRKADFSDAVQEFFSDYGRRLEENGLREFERLPYGYGVLLDGSALPPHSASFIRAEEEFLAVDFRRPSHTNVIKALFNRPAFARGDSRLTKYLLHLWCIREDLRQAFPGVLRDDAEQSRLIAWFCNIGTKQLRLDDWLLQPMRQAPMDRPRFSLSPRGAVAKLLWLLRPLFPLSLRRRFGGPIFRFVLRHQRQTVTARGDEQVATRRANDASDGVNVWAYFNAQSGIGQAGRAMATALETVCCEISRVPIEVGFRGGQVPFNQVLSESCPFRVTVICANADQLPVLANQPQWELIQHSYKVGVWYWELEEFPEEFARNAQFLEEIWVGSEFVRAAISKKISSVPISVVPPAVKLPAPTSFGREHFGLSESDFVIFAAMDCLSLVNRKNPQAVYDAFTRMKAKTGATDLKLCIKLSNVEQASVDALVTRLRGDSTVILLDEDLERSEYSELVRSVDLVVSLHRSEGFGLVPAEAMSVSKCVVATAYGGNTDYMNESNSLLINYEVAPVGEGSSPYPTDAHWAEPDLDDAVRKMVLAYESPELRHKLGLAAARDMSERYSPAAVSEILKERWRILQNVRAPGDE